MSRKVIRLVLISVFALILCGFQRLSAQTPYQDEYTDEFAFSPGGSFSLNNVRGTVRITGTDEESFTLRAVKIVTKAESRQQAEKMLGRVTIEVKKGEKTVSVTTRYPKGKKTFSFEEDREEDSSEDSPGSLIGKLSRAWGKLVDAVSGELDFDFGTGVPVEVNYEIRLPRFTVVEVNNVDGKVEIIEIEGDLEANLVNGDFSLIRLDGDIEANLVNGSMHIVAASGSIEANNINGSINFESAGIERKRGAGFNVMNGDVLIRLDESAAVDLELTTFAGEVEVEMPVTIEGKINRKRIIGELNGGGPPIEVNVINGDIRVKKI